MKGEDEYERGGRGIKKREEERRRGEITKREELGEKITKRKGGEKII